MDVELLKAFSGFFAGYMRFHPNTTIIDLPPHVSFTLDVWTIYSQWLTGNTSTAHPSWLNISPHNSPVLQFTRAYHVVDRDTIMTKYINGAILDRIIAAYVLSDFLLVDPRFQNWVMCHISLCYNYLDMTYGFPIYNLQYNFDNTTEKSMLQRYIAQRAFCAFTPATLAMGHDIGDLLPQHMLDMWVTSFGGDV